MRKQILAAACLLVVALTLACGGKSKPAATSTPGAATQAAVTPTTGASQATATVAASPTVASTPTPVPPPQLSDLSLVWVDTSKGKGAEVYVASATGAQPKLVATVAEASGRPLDVMGKTLVLAGQTKLYFVDLTTGQVRSLDSGAIFNARFLDDGSLVYTTRAGCGGPDLSNSTLYRLNVDTLKPAEIVSRPANMTIAGASSVASGQGTPVVAIAPRGCDVGVSTYLLVSLQDGKTVQTYDAMGCGWIVAAPGQNKAVVSRKSCTPPKGHEGADATVYDYGIVGPTDHDVTAPDAGSSDQPWILRPGSALVALATTKTVGTGPGSTRGGGVYLLDLANRSFTNVAPGDGAEQFPVQWSPGGRYLLYGVTEAQGVCHYEIADLSTVGSPKLTPVDTAVSFCGVNGSVAGLTKLK